MIWQALVIVLDLIGKCLTFYFDSHRRKQRQLEELDRASRKMDSVFNRAAVDLSLEIRDQAMEPMMSQLDSVRTMTTDQINQITKKEVEKTVAKHKGDGKDCPKCREMLGQAHKRLRRFVEHAFIDFEGERLHISCTWRNEAAQAAAHKKGLTLIKNGSMHQCRNEKGEPEARAVDFFVLSPCGTKALYDDGTIKLMDRIKRWANYHKIPILNGSDWTSVAAKRLQDHTHFELVMQLVHEEEAF